MTWPTYSRNALRKASVPFLKEKALYYPLTTVHPSFTQRTDFNKAKQILRNSGMKVLCLLHKEILTDAFSMVVKTPVDSTTYSAPALAHGMLAGSRSENTAIFWPGIKLNLVRFLV